MPQVMGGGMAIVAVSNTIGTWLMDGDNLAQFERTLDILNIQYILLQMSMLILTLLSLLWWL